MNKGEELIVSEPNGQIDCCNAYAIKSGMEGVRCISFYRFLVSGMISCIMSLLMCRLLDVGSDHLLNRLILMKVRMTLPSSTSLAMQQLCVVRVPACCVLEMVIMGSLICRLQQGKRR